MSKGATYLDYLPMKYKWQLSDFINWENDTQGDQSHILEIIGFGLFIDVSGDNINYLQYYDNWDAEDIETYFAHSTAFFTKEFNTDSDIEGNYTASFNINQILKQHPEGIPVLHHKSNHDFMRYKCEINDADSAFYRQLLDDIASDIFSERLNNTYMHEYYSRPNYD